MNSTTIITAEQVRQCPDLRLFDEDSESGLQLYSYAQCTDASSDLVKACRGIVIDGTSIVSRTFGYTREFVYPDQAAEITNLFTETAPVSACLFYPAIEGSIVRLFSSKGRWCLSTFRKLNANTSKWQSRHSFGELFMQGLNTLYTSNSQFQAWLGQTSDVFQAFVDRLDPSMTHTFILPSTKETRQCAAGSDVQEVLYTGSFDTAGQFFKLTNLMVPTVAYHTFATVDEAMTNIASLNAGIEAGRDQSQGVMVILPNHSLIKITASSYRNRRNIRGNTPSVTSRYVDIYNDAQQRDSLRALYPERAAEFNTMDQHIRTICRTVHRIYMDRHVHKQRIVVHPILNFLDKELHARHKSTGERITPAVVEGAVCRQAPHFLQQLIRLSASGSLN